MEPLFEVITEGNRDPDPFAEYYRYAAFRSPASIAFYVIYFVLAVVLVVGGILLHAYYMFALAVLPVFFIIFFPIFRYRQIMKSRKKQIEELKCSASRDTVSRIYETNVEFVSPRMTEPASVDLSEINFALNGKTVVYLQTKARHVLAFPKDSFLKGTPEELVGFLRRKGIKIRK